MPTVRSPCTFEWPRSGQMPAPSRPMLPRRRREVHELLHVARAEAMLRDAHAVAEDHALGAGVDAGRMLDLGFAKRPNRERSHPNS